MNQLNQTNPPLLKICGVTRAEDMLACERYGVDFIGLNFFQGSSRFVSPDQAAKLAKRASNAKLVGVAVDASVDMISQWTKLVPQIEIWQLHGNETPGEAKKIKDATGRKIWKAIKVSRPESLNATSE